MLFWAKEIKENATKWGRDCKSGSDYTLSALLLCSAHENLRSTEKFYSHGV